jgi:protein-S-isoprenylcysteine O-methyltransferase Ste14
LSVLWVGIGAAISGFFFVSSTQPVTASSDGSANMIAIAILVAVAAWLVLAFPVLIVGGAQFRGRERRQLLWTCAWVVGLALMVLTRVLLDNLPERITCGTDGCGVVPYYGPAVVNGPELVICVAFLAIGTLMTWALARPAQLRRNEAT